MKKTDKARVYVSQAAILSVLQGCSALTSNSIKLSTPAEKRRVEGFKLTPTTETYSSCEDLQADFYNQLLVKKEADLIQQAEWKSRKDVQFETSAAPTAENADTDSGSSESFTNIQEKGVDEGDHVKIGEHHIVTESFGTLQVVDRESLSLIGTLRLEGPFDNTSTHFQDMYIDKDHLVTIQGSYSPYSFCGNDYQVDTERKVSVRFFKLTKGQLPSEIRSIEYQGTYSRSRLVNGHLILVLNDTVEFKDEISDTYWDLSSATIPNEPLKLKDGKTTSGIECSNIVKQAIPDLSNSLTTVHSIPVRDENKSIKTVAALGTGNQMYMSPRSLFLAKQNYYWSPRPEDQESTAEELENLESASLLAIDFDQDTGDLEVAASGMVRGRIKDQWSFKDFSEEEALAVMTTTGTSWGEYLENHLWILKKSNGILETTASVQNFGSNEDIKSVRYVGRIAYAVTFRQVDPLFAFDLSDLDNPTMLGELKIPGFSAYMHPTSEGRLLGLGYDGDESGRIGGIQISLFDTSDPKNLSRLANDVNGSRSQYANSEAIFDHHAFLYSHKYQIAAFPLHVDNYNSLDAQNQNSSEFKRGSVVYSLADDKLNQIGYISHDSLLPVGCDSRYNNLGIRRLYEVDDKLISISPLGLMSHGLNNLETAEKVTKFKVLNFRCQPSHYYQ